MDASVKSALALVLQSSPRQEQLWKLSLQSQGFEVISDSPDIDILSCIVKFRPHIALIDVSGGQFNPFEISRQSAKKCPLTAIVYTNHKRADISNFERQYAKKQMAADLISAPNTARDLRNAISTIVGLSEISRPFDPIALRAAFRHAPKKLKKERVTPPTPTVEKLLEPYFDSPTTPVPIPNPSKSAGGGHVVRSKVSVEETLPVTDREPLPVLAKK